MNKTTIAEMMAATAPRCTQEKSECADVQEHMKKTNIMTNVTPNVVTDIANSDKEISEKCLKRQARNKRKALNKKYQANALIVKYLRPRTLKRKLARLKKRELMLQKKYDVFQTFFLLEKIKKNKLEIRKLS